MLPIDPRYRSTPDFCLYLRKDACNCGTWNTARILTGEMLHFTESAKRAVLCDAGKDLCEGRRRAQEEMRRKHCQKSPHTHARNHSAPRLAGCRP
jgi:hypothetical protein